MDTQQLDEARKVIAWWEDRQRRHLDDPDVPLTAIAGAYLRHRRDADFPSALTEHQVTVMLAGTDHHHHPRPQCLPARGG